MHLCRVELANMTPWHREFSRVAQLSACEWATCMWVYSVQVGVLGSMHYCFVIVIVHGTNIDFYAQKRQHNTSCCCFRWMKHLSGKTHMRRLNEQCFFTYNSYYYYHWKMPTAKSTVRLRFHSVSLRHTYTPHLGLQRNLRTWGFVSMLCVSPTLPLGNWFWTFMGFGQANKQTAW